MVATVFNYAYPCLWSQVVLLFKPKASIYTGIRVEMLPFFCMAACPCLVANLLLCLSLLLVYLFGVLDEWPDLTYETQESGLGA
jgi:hypothetical protein